MVNNYYQQHKERLQKEAYERNQILSKEGKGKIRKKARERYQSFTEEEKEKRPQYYLQRKKKLPDYRRNYHLTDKE